MNIRPSNTIRENYNEIAELCRKTKEPVFLIKNDEVDLVVMDMDTYTRIEKELKLQAEFLADEKTRVHRKRGVYLK